QGLRRIINAEEAFISVNHWVFLRGVYYEFDRQGQVERVIRYEREEVVTRSTVEELIKARKNPQEMSYAELRRTIADERGRGQQTRPLELMLWQRTAIPFACLVFSLVGVPLGLTSPRSGKSVGIGLSILVVFGYYVFFSLSGALSEGGTIPPVAGAWLGNLLGTGVGVVLLWLKDRH
ncbi:MAG TPA: LptF/LptG family permease, partial [Atribacteraceae bacterium]|nr:LptF/LptG family permease [Atribacteraceae bacterium]